ncbi:hypothetical protein AXY1_46 [Achromobacter phage AXY1]|nr:hypothetical protein AXY1_46 [Achromobacter phage AXY1]
MQRIYNACLFILFSTWAIVAYAQTTEYPAFGSELSSLSWSTWRWVFLFCFLGSSVRFLMDLKAGKMRERIVDRIIDVLSIFTVGFAAGFIVFVICEYLNQTAGKRYIPDLAICGLMFAAAINKEAVFSYVSAKFNAVVMAVAKSPTK